jgi:hypothetical protein
MIWSVSRAWPLVQRQPPSVVFLILQAYTNNSHSKGEMDLIAAP